MFRNEREFADHVEHALQAAGFTTEREVPVRTGHRLDILATKKGTKSGIEVKFERRGILDDLSKCHVLLRLPDVDEMYACGPMMFMDEDVEAMAKQLAVGLVAVRDTGELKWLAPCPRLEPPRLSLGGNTVSQVDQGGQVPYTVTVFNNGQKAAVNLELRMVLAAPFVARLPSKARARRSLLEGRDQWSVPLQCTVKRNARPGKYPLLISLTADNAVRQDHQMLYEVRKAPRKNR